MKKRLLRWLSSAPCKSNAHPLKFLLNPHRCLNSATPLLNMTGEINEPYSNMCSLEKLCESKVYADIDRSSDNLFWKELGYLHYLLLHLRYLIRNVLDPFSILMDCCQEGLKIDTCIHTVLKYEIIYNISLPPHTRLLT